MKKTAITMVLGLGLVMAGFAQSSPKPKGRPGAAKPLASPKAKPPKLGSSRPASGPTIIRAKPKPSQLVAALDANEDGKLSFKEIEAAVAALKKLDQNKDGELTLNEFGPAPEVAKQSRGSLGKPGGAKPSVSARPSGRPGRRPTTKPSGQPSGKPKAVAGRTPGTKKPGARPTRPGARPRPSSKPGQANRGDGTSAKGGAPTAKASPRRVAKKAPARKVSKAARTVDPDIQTLIDETAAVTELIRRAAPKIKNLAKKRAAQNWTRRGSRAFLRSLNNIQDQDKAVKLVEAKQKLEEVRKLLE